MDDTLLDILENLNTEISEEIFFRGDVTYTNILKELNICMDRHEKRNGLGEHKSHTLDDYIGGELSHTIEKVKFMPCTQLPIKTSTVK